MTAAVVQSQTQRFRNQNAESQGQSKGKGRKSGWLHEEQAHTLVTDGDRPWKGLQGELGDLENHGQDLQELARLHLHLQS